MAYPTLNQNEIYSALYNMIISQEIWDRIGDGNEIVDKAKVDGTLYGDTKLYYAADALSSSAWGNDAEAANLLSLDRPEAPECQAIVLDTFRQIRLTLDDYLSKRAWADEGAFGQFNSVMEGMIGKTKRIYDVCTYNCFIGNVESSEGAQTPTALTLTSGKEGQEIAQALADIVAKITDVSRDYNDYGQITKFGLGEIKPVWNSKFVNMVKNTELPGMFNKDIVENVINKGDVLESKYWGHAIVDGTDIDSSTKKAEDGVVIRAKVELVVGSGTSAKHYFPGEQFDADTTFGTSRDVALADAYVEDANIICKLFVKFPPYMSAFEVGTSFFNPRSLTTNRYLTFGHNSLDYLKAFPVVTIKKN